MGGAVEGGVGIADKTSPRRAEIEKNREELRQTCEIRDKTKKELEFLLDGGNPLELESGNAASVSVQSTSFTEQRADQLVTSEAKGSFAFASSPHADSVESSGRLGENPWELNSADNLMLFDTERQLSERNRRSSHPSRSNIVSSEKLSHIRGNYSIGEHGDSAVFDLPRKAYKRRYRPRANRDGTSSTDVNQTHGCHGSSLPSCHDPKDAKGLISDVETQIMLSKSNSKPARPVDDALHKTVLTSSQQDIELDGINTVDPTKDQTEGRQLNSVSDAIACEIQLHDQHDQQSLADIQRTIQIDSNGRETIPAVEGVSFADIKCQPGVTAIRIENKSSSHQMNGSSSEKGEGTKNDAHNSASCGMKGLDSESSSTQTSQTIDGTKYADTTNMRSADLSGQVKDQISIPANLAHEVDKSMIEKMGSGIVSSTAVTVKSSVACQIEQEDGVKLQPGEEFNENGSVFKSKVKDQPLNEAMGSCKLTESDSVRKSAEPSIDLAGPNIESFCSLRHQDSTGISIPDLPGGGLSLGVSTAPIEAQMSEESDPKLTRRIDEDSILKEAKKIEAKRKRIAEFSIVDFPKKTRLKSRWDYVLEEMAWLANDFTQERIWKIVAAAQISSSAAFTCQVRKLESSFHMKAKQVAHSLAKSVMEFWQLVEDKSKLLDQQGQGEDEHSVQAYAMRFQKYKNCSAVYNPAEVQVTADGASDIEIPDPSRKECLMKENLFYTVLPGTMETYRCSVESHVTQFQRILGGVIDGVETSACDAAADNAEDERGKNTYDMSMAFEDSNKSGFGQKKQKHFISARPYEVNSDISYMQGAENKVVHQSALLAKRPGGYLNVTIPTKRVRTASRRVVSPFTPGTSGFLQASKADATSGDTNSYQDDQSTLHSDLHAAYNVEVESVVKFEKQSAVGSAEVSVKHTKKKKAKHLNAAYEPRWQVDSTFQNEQIQRDHLRKSHQLESNCSSGLLGQPVAKKQKTMRQSQDISFENITPIGGSVPSPAASQMSNMSNTNKFIKMLGGRDQGRKQKLLKMPAGQPGSGSPWTLFEDQALVVLAHDLGPNWELVSDAINNTLQFKCVFRKAKECKERHNFLMDRSSGDGADSADDCGSSPPYPSTLPGIPKGSARQLFQRLQGPMEEDTLKSHFEKIIIIGQKQHYRKTQDSKQLQQPHSSHTVALSQVNPNNLNGGLVLTPLDLCDSIAGSDVLPLGYQGPHSGGLAIPNQGTVTKMHPASGPTSSVQGSPPMIVGSNFSSSPSSLNSSVRYGHTRPIPLPGDEEQRMLQYNEMMSGRSGPQPNIPAPGALPVAGRGVRMLPGGSGMGLASGINRGMPIGTSGFQGTVSSPVVNSGSTVSHGMPSSNMHSGVGSGQGSSMLKPREAVHMMRPGLGQESPTMMPVDLQMQAPPGNSQIPHHFSGLSSPFPNQTVSPPVPSYSLQHPISPRHHPRFPGPTANHTPGHQQQAYAMRLAKERQQQNRSLQPPQVNTPHSLAQHGIHPQPPLPLQNNPQVQPRTGSPPISLSPMNSMKQQAPTQGLTRNAPSGGTNQTTKQRQRQQQNQLSQANRPHPQQRLQTNSPQPASNSNNINNSNNNNNVTKGVGRGNSVAQPNVPIDHALINGVSTSQRQFVPPQKNYLGQGAQSAQNLRPMASLTDKNNLGYIPVTGSNHQQTPALQKSATNSQLPIQRVVQQQNKLQTRDPSSDPNLTSISTEMNKVTTLPQAAANANAPQWQTSEPLLDQTTLCSGTSISSVAPEPLKASGSTAHNTQQHQLLPQRSQPPG